jgi:hypothetical protein
LSACIIYPRHAPLITGIAAAHHDLGQDGLHVSMRVRFLNKINILLFKWWIEITVFGAAHNNYTAMQKLKGGVIMRPVSQLLTVIAIAVLVGRLQIISPSTVSKFRKSPR